MYINVSAREGGEGDGKCKIQRAYCFITTLIGTEGGTKVGSAGILLRRMLSMTSTQFSLMLLLVSGFPSLGVKKTRNGETRGKAAATTCGRLLLRFSIVYNSYKNIFHKCIFGAATNVVFLI